MSEEQLKLVRYYKRRLSDTELREMYGIPEQTSDTWIKLSDAQPAMGAFCKWWVADGRVDDMGEGHYMRVTTTINGEEVGANGFSCKGKGLMISPPEHTYWKEVCSD